jgi:hypothetical protein
MARDQVLLDLYHAVDGPFPEGLGGVVIEGVELVDVTDGIAGAASFYVNNTRALTADHRAWLQEYVADIGTIESLLSDDDALDYFLRHRDLARYLLATR